MSWSSEAERLERLWSGEFGALYTERNLDAGTPRQEFWRTLTARIQPDSVLEVGCNAGANLGPLHQFVEPTRLVGIDVNPQALTVLRGRYPEVNALWGRAVDLPFRDDWFQLVFTCGVLIHQPDETLLPVMAEVVRCSNRWILCAEYEADQPVEVPYRGERGALFKRPYADLYVRQFPQLELVDSGWLGPEDGFDNVTWHLLRKT